MPMLIKSVKNKDYGLLVDNVKINMEQGYIISRLKNVNYEKFYLNDTDKMWYFKNYKKDIKLIDILYPDKNILEIQFKNNDYNNYLPDNLIIKLDPKFENSFIEPPNYQILEEGKLLVVYPNIPEDFSINKSNDDNPDTKSNDIKPIMPANFSITTVNSIDYIQFCKKINDKKHQYKTKINSLDIKSELSRFINELNEKYELELNPLDYPITNTNGWTTTNQIITHTDSAEKQSQRERTQRYLVKKKQELGEDEFRKQNAEKAKAYRQTK